MCLLTKFPTPIVSKEDLYVLKRVDVLEDGKIVTPYLNFPMQFNEMMYAGGEHTFKEHTTYDCEHYEYEGGWIHSFLHRHLDIVNYEYILCIIPNGSLYQINNTMNEICSDKLLIGDKLYNEREDAEEVERLLNESKLKALVWMLDENISKGEVNKEWFYMMDGSFIHPSEVVLGKKDIGDVIGVVYDIDEDERVASVYSIKTEFFRGFGAERDLCHSSNVSSKEELLEKVKEEIMFGFWDGKEYEGWGLPELGDIEKFLNVIGYYNYCRLYETVDMDNCFKSCITDLLCCKEEDGGGGYKLTTHWLSDAIYAVYNGNLRIKLVKKIKY